MSDPRPYSLSQRVGETFWFIEPPQLPITVRWEDIVGAPTQFPVEYHEHAAEDISGLEDMFRSYFTGVPQLRGSTTKAGVVWLDTTLEDGSQEGALFRRGGSGTHDGVNVILRDDGIFYTRCQ